MPSITLAIGDCICVCVS